MATQHDNIDVPHLVRIGVIGTIITIATSYFVTGLTHLENTELQQERMELYGHKAEPHELSDQEAADLEVARQTVLNRYAR